MPIGLTAKIEPKNGAFQGMVDAEQTIVDASVFTGNLSATDTDLQTALVTIDGLVLGTGGSIDGGFANSIYLITQVLNGGGA